MKALTVCQPWAWALLQSDPEHPGWAIKPVENRTWPTQYRGRLVIHAGKSGDWWEEGRLALKDRGYKVPIRWSMVFGGVLGEVQLVDCVPIDEALDRGLRFASGPWCWVLQYPVMYPRPVAYRGRQGLWTIDESVVWRARHRFGPPGAMQTLWESQEG